MGLGAARNLLKTAAAVAALAVTSADARGDTIAVWNFNLGSTTGSGSANEAALLTVNHGAGTMTTTADPNFVVSFTGTTNGAYAGDAAGAALAIQNGTSGENNGTNLTWTASTAGESNITVSFAIQATATGFNNDQFQYTTDGTTWTNFGNAFAPNLTSNSGFSVPAGLVTFDLSSITALNGDANAGFRIVFNGGSSSSSSGNNRIDNVIVSGTAVAVPEPATFVMMGIGLFGVTSLGLRRRLRPSGL
ncbi:MAG: PEP-CTERM sorting domain-containing protein [Isosphaeraceae bacterium]|nr:PEP-CTERM sorting domain-containing protein [Isosphaeraceae bacterium]